MTVGKKLEFSRPVALTDLAGGEIRIMAETDERAALARRLGLVALDSLHATVCLDPKESGGGVRLRGTLRADVTQACVVTLEPMRSSVEAPFERRYARAEGQRPPEPEDIPPDGEEPPEPLVGDTVDLGEAVAEQLALEIEPFPRTPNAAFSGYVSGTVDTEDAEDGAEPSGPFAALAEIKGLRRDSE